MKSKEHITMVMVGKSGVQIFFRIFLGIFLMYAGTGHLTFSRIEFQAQVPSWVPMNKDLVVILSGIVEILMGGLLVLLSKHRIMMGCIAAIFFILVFPGNISQYLDKINAFGLNTDFKRGMRLLFQPILVIWALWSTGAWKAWRIKKSVVQN